jgi:hypothetical protein
VRTLDLPSGFIPGPDDRAAVARLIGRDPKIGFRVALRRRSSGEPVVIENAPFSPDGSPNPNWFWLVDPAFKLWIDHLEAEGGVKRAESQIDPLLIERSHRIYASGRRSLADACGVGDPGGGVGGTRQGVKCLHAHVAYHLVGGYAPVGAWALRQLR